MVTLKEYLGRYDPNFIDVPHQKNIDTLLIRVNEIRKLYGKPMLVTSGYRSKEDHERIYKAKGLTKIPWGSKHLIGAAIDISDPKQDLQAWCLANIPALEKAQLWCEDFSATRSWVHFQTFPPGSGKRFFLP